MPFLWEEVEDVISKMKKTIKTSRELREVLEEEETE